MDEERKTVSIQIPGFPTVERQRRMVMDLFIAMECSGDFFRAKIFRLFAKADGLNIQKLRMGFEQEYQVFRAWHEFPGSFPFFAAHHIKELLHEGSRERRIYEGMEERYADD